MPDKANAPAPPAEATGTVVSGASATTTTGSSTATSAAGDAPVNADADSMLVRNGYALMKNEGGKSVYKKGTDIISVDANGEMSLGAAAPPAKPPATSPALPPPPTKVS